MEIPTINYLEVRSSNKILDTLYIGNCDYETDKFTLCNFHKMNEFVISQKDAPTVINCCILNKHDIQQINKAINIYEPENMDENSALYDLKLVSFWINKKQEEYKSQKLDFVLVTYFAVLENLEYNQIFGVDAV